MNQYAIRTAVHSESDLTDELNLTLAAYQPRLSLEMEVGKYLIRTARNGSELLGAITLRHTVFYQELLGMNLALGIDYDQYDAHFDHIILVEKATKRIIGTYRLNCSRFSSLCYSDSEFDCSTLRHLPGNRLELGRACLAPEFRSGTHFILLWRGILKYAQLSRSRYLYGCASVRNTSENDLVHIYKQLHESYACHPKWHIRPRPSYAILDFARRVQDLPYPIDGEDHLLHVPSLLWFYFKAGARLCGEPAIDRQFQCADFPIILDLEKSLAPIKQRIAG